MFRLADVLDRARPRRPVFVLPLPPKLDWVLESVWDLDWPGPFLLEHYKNRRDEAQIIRGPSLRCPMSSRSVRLAS